MNILNLSGLGFLSAYASIVFVHGLQGHPRKTWTRKVTEAPSARTSAGETGDEAQRSRRSSFPGRREPRNRERQRVNDVFWPADLLPLDCPQARILTWGYESQVSNFFGGAANQSHISTHAKDLFYGLRKERANCVRLL